MDGVGIAFHILRFLVRGDAVIAIEPVSEVALGTSR
jgi:hypothetical protein